MWICRIGTRVRKALLQVIPLSVTKSSRNIHDLRQYFSAMLQSFTLLLFQSHQDVNGSQHPTSSSGNRSWSMASLRYHHSYPSQSLEMKGIFLVQGFIHASVTNWACAAVWQRTSSLLFQWPVITGHKKAATLSSLLCSKIGRISVRSFLLASKGIVLNWSEPDLNVVHPLRKVKGSKR